jgi:DNA-binding MarR family transcriptional regulator
VGRAGEFDQDRGGVLVAGIVKDPGEELGPFPGRAPASFGEQEPSPLAPGQVPLQQGEDLLLLMIEMVTEDAAELLGGRGHPDAAGQGGIDRPDGGHQAAVLGDHEVKLVQVLGLGQVVPQHRPQVVVLGGMVDLQGLTEGGPALGRGAWPAVPALELGGEGLEAGRVTAQPGMDGPHEAKVGRAVVVAGLRSPAAPPNGQDRRTGRNPEEQQPRWPSPCCPRHRGSLLLDSWASVDRRTPAVEAQNGAHPPPSPEIVSTGNDYNQKRFQAATFGAMTDQSPSATPSAAHLRVPGVAFLLAQLGFHSTQLWKDRLAPLGIDPRHAVLLRHVAAAQGQSQQALGRAMQIPPSRMVALVDELERAGLLERRPSPADRRAHALHLTGDGRRLLEGLMQVSAEHEAHLCAGLTQAERHRLIDLLSRIAAEQGLPTGVHPGVAATNPDDRP